MKPYKVVLPLVALLIVSFLPSMTFGAISQTQILIQNGNYSIPFILKGNGTEENPYIIQNLTLRVSGLPAILIKNSHKHLIIRNVTVYSSGAFYAIEIENSSNVTLEDVKILQSDNFGIGIMKGWDLKFIDVYMQNCPLPIYFEKLSDRNNYFKGIYINGVKAAFFRNRSNFTLNGTYSYLSLYNCSQVSGKVEVVSKYVGIDVIFSKGIKLEVNVTADSYGMRIYYSQHVRVLDSEFSKVGYNTLVIQNSSAIFISDVTAGEAFQGFISASDSTDLVLNRITTSGALGQLTRCRNVIIEHSSGSEGLGISESYNVTLESLSFQYVNHNVLEIYSSYKILVENSHFIGIRYMMGKFKQKPVKAVEVIFSKDVEFSQDTFYNDWTGVFFLSSQDVLLDGDYFSECTQGIVVKQEWGPSENYTIKNCEFISSDVAGVSIYAGTGFYIVHNLFENNQGWALVIMTNGSAEVYLNTFTGNSKDVDEWCHHLYYNPELKKGNYWSRYHGVDRNHDGIGDTPYQVSNYSVDKYPLMKPTFTTVYTPKLPKKGLSDVDKFFIFVGAVAAISIALHYTHFRKKKKGEE